MNRRLRNFICGVLILISIAVIFVGMKNSISVIDHEKMAMNELFFVDEVEGKQIILAPWEASEDGIYYLILPSLYLQKTFEVEVTYDDRFYSIYIDNKKYIDGDIWNEKLEEEVHQLRVEDLFGNIYMEKPFQVLISEGVPAVMVTVEAKEELFIKDEYANKQYVERGNILFWGENGKILLDETMERFKIRGNLTATYEKKPFTITLPSAVSLCGMSESQNWHLLANATDGTHIRNKIMLDWAEELRSEYQPNGKHVDLFINGEYQGLYLLTETVEVQEKRLNISSMNSILVEMELYYRALQEDNCIVTDREHYWVAHSESILQEEQLEEIEAYLEDIESALYAIDGVSEISGRKLNEMLDFDSWTDSWLLKEISSDHDLGTTSQFGVVEDWENRSIFVAGPEWDFDGTFGNGMVPWSNNPRNLAAALPNTKGIESISQNKWLSKMYQHKEFRDMLIQKFEEEVQPKIEKLIEYEIDNYVDEIRRPALLDSLRWNGNAISRYFNLPNDYSIEEKDDYQKYDVLDQHVKVLKEFLYEKEKFLVELWLDGVEFEIIVEECKDEDANLDLNNDIYTWVRKDGVE